MPTHVARYAKGETAQVSTDGHLTLLTDLSRDPVFLKGRVRCGSAFSRAMLVLGQIVKTAARATAKDHSAYQEWVHGQYLKEMTKVQARRLDGLPKLRERELALSAQISALQGEISEASDKIDDMRELHKFYDWLYAHNKDAWIQIDPIVSVQHDATFFEGFSIDESIYGRVKLLHASMESSNPINPGTTNIDFGLGLEKELSRIRSYRPLDLTVGANAVEVETAIGSATEKKIDLPETWVRGLVEVQSALMFAPVTVQLRPTFLAEIISRLEAERETHGPRSLKFLLTPGQPVSVEIEPWGVILIDRDSNYRGDQSTEIRVWGRRRLLLLKDILPDATTIEVRLLGSGMPSFWTVHVDDIELTVGLSGWTTLDWASRARFSAMMPSGAISSQLVIRAAALLKGTGHMTADQLAKAADVTPVDARGALQKLCLAGKAMFEPETLLFRWRELFPEFDLEQLSQPGLEERKGIELHAANAVTVEEDTWNDGRHRVAARVSDESERTTALETDLDGRVLYAECTCSHYRYHKLRQGPCRHMVAVTLH